MITMKIEPLRREKTVGSSLEVEINLPDGTDYDVDLAELFISSVVTRGVVDEAEFTKTTHQKCGRCWRHLPEVSADGALCGRCAEVVNG